MSDLAAFVASTIESRVVADLKEENDQLRAEIDKTRAAALQSARRGGCVEITGQGGSPVYAYGMLHKAELVGFAEGVKYDYYISLVDTGEKCQISKALNAEIRINGIRVATIGEYDRQLTPMDMVSRSSFSIDTSIEMDIISQQYWRYIVIQRTNRRPTQIILTIKIFVVIIKWTTSSTCSHYKSYVMV